jgi:GNAT superfamily N-acetyltransferase
VIRAAEPGDLPELIEMAGAMHAESVYRDLLFSPLKTANTFFGWMNDADGCFFVYVGGDGRIAGFIAGHVADHFFAAARGAWDRIFYVRPERRGGVAAYRLYVHWRQWVSARGAQDAFPAVMTSESCAGENFCRGLGMEPVAVLFRDRLELE